MKRICVFCGSNHGSESIYKEEAKRLGEYLAKNKMEVIYGGSNLGLMGEIARAALALQGKVTAVMPEFLKEMAGHDNDAELIVTDTMHERKQKMFELADAFIAFPGGYGTFEEIFEMLAWSQLGVNTKPCGFLNINNYYDKLLNFLDHANAHEFVNNHHRNLALVADNIEDLLEKFNSHEPKPLGIAEKWIPPTPC